MNKIKKLTLAVIIGVLVLELGMISNIQADSDDINEGLVAYFPFNDASGFDDAIGWLRGVEPIGLSDFPDRLGVVSCACDFYNPEKEGGWFDQAEAYIEIPDQCEIRFSNAFSFSVWVYFIDYPGHKDVHIIAKKMRLYMLIDDSFSSLTEKGVPEDILNQLQTLTNNGYKGKNEFTEALKASIGESQTAEYQSLIVEESLQEAVNSYNLWITQDNTLLFSLRKNASEWSRIQYPSFSGREWTHIAAVWDGEFMRLYVNGVMAGEEELAGPIPYDEYDDNPVYIGADNQNSESIPEEGWNGYMDDFRIYDRSLSASEIQELQSYANDHINVVRSDFVHIDKGSQEADFKMVSFNYMPDNPSALEIFGDQLIGGYDTDRYKIGTYDPTVGEYLEYGENLKIIPGKAYWIYAKDGLDIEVNGIPVCKNEDIEIELKYNPYDKTKGRWNMIATPNNALYLWDDIEVVLYDAENRIEEGYPKKIEDADIISKKLWRWVNGSYVFYSPSQDDADSYPEYYDPSEQCLIPHEGYWVDLNKNMMSDISGKKVCLKFSANAQCKPNDCLRSERGKRNNSPSSTLPDDIECPPSPLGGFNERDDVSVEDGGGGGCFITDVTSSPFISVFKKIIKWY